MNIARTERYLDRLAKGVWHSPEKPIKASGRRSPTEPDRLNYNEGWALFDTLVTAEVAYSGASPASEWFPEGTRARVYVYAAALADDPAWMDVPQARAMARAILRACRLAEAPPTPLTAEPER